VEGDAGAVAARLSVPYPTSGWLLYEWGGSAPIVVRSRNKIDLSSVIYDYQKRSR
jgi:hypothetical protein